MVYNLTLDRGQSEVLDELPAVRTIGVSDLGFALARGWNDFQANPTHVLFLIWIFPVLGLVLCRMAFGYDMLPLVFPLISGFALIGPLAALGVYELSRRRESGARAFWADAFAVLKSPAFPSILGFGLLLLGVFLAWLYAANLIYQATFGSWEPRSIEAFVQAVLVTPEGRDLIVYGIGAGFLFAVLVLAISIVSLPLLLDRNTGIAVAVLTSVRAVLANPGPIALWGLIVAAALVIGTLPAFIGLAVVLPVLGHATWHLYRRLVVR